MGQQNRLVEIDRKDWPILKQLYLNIPKSFYAYITIDTYIRWTEQDPSLDGVNIFCLNGNFSDGTFVSIDKHRAYADTLNSSYENLFRLLHLIDYTKEYTFVSVRFELRHIMIEALKKLHVEFTNVINDHKIFIYRLSKEEALKFDVRPPGGIKLHSLNTPEYMEKVDSLWDFRDNNSLSYLERLVTHNPSVGAIKEDGTLVAWTLRFGNGLIGALQTDSNYYRHGYAMLVTKYLSKNIAEMGHDVYVGIFDNNTSSRSLFEKLGFKWFAEQFLIRNNPKEGTGST